METAIFGGSFNPPTRAHEAIVRSCLEQPDIESVWIMPSGDRIDKQYSLADTDRLWMLHLMREEVFDDSPRVVISPFELDYLPRPTQTWRTVKLLREYYPGHYFRFIFGADSYWDMPKWEQGEQLQAELPMLLVPRAAAPLPVANNVHMLPVDTAPAYSSTEVKENLTRGLDISQMVCGAVRSYIADLRLYGTI